MMDLEKNNYMSNIIELGSFTVLHLHQEGSASALLLSTGPRCSRTDLFFSFVASTCKAI